MKKDKRVKAGKLNLVTLLFFCVFIIFIGTIAVIAVKENAAKYKVELGKYKGVTVTVTPTKEEITAAKNTFCEENLSEKKGIQLKKGDTVKVDFVGTIKKKEFEGGTANDVILTIGDNEYLEEFEEGLIGAKVGETVSINGDFPDDYNDATLAGKRATFKTKIKAVKVAYSDSLVKEATNGKYTTMKEYDLVLAEKVKKESLESAQEEAWGLVMENARVEAFDSDFLDTAVADTKEEYIRNAKSSGSTYEKVLDELGATNQDVEDEGKVLAKERKVAQTIIEKENILFDDTVYRTTLAKTLQKNDEDEGVGNPISYSQLTLERLEKDYKATINSSPKADMMIVIAKEFVKKNAIIK